MYDDTVKALYLVAFVLLATAAAPGQESRLTVPGERIGPVRLGAPESVAVRHNLAALRGEAACPVHFRAESGLLAALATSTGGLCPTAGGTQPGAPLAIALAEFGRDHTTVPAETYPHGRASWHVWDAAGFAARAVLPAGSISPGEAVITCIAVFTPGGPFRPRTCSQP